MKRSGLRLLVFSVIASAIIIIGAIAFIPPLISHNPPVSPSLPLSNVTVNVSIEPVMQSPASASFYQYIPSNYSGALVQMFPVYHPVSNIPGYYLRNSNISAMATDWLNHTWNAQFRLPLAMYSLAAQWRSYFGSATMGETSFIVIITYFFKHNSTYNIAYSATTTAPYSPFKISSRTGGLVNVTDHPVLSNRFYTMVPDIYLDYPSTPVYTNYSEPVNNTPIMNPPSGSPYGSSGYGNQPAGIGNQRYYWVWRLSSSLEFLNSEIPISYLNETKSGLQSEAGDAVSIGSIDYSTEFSMARTTYNSSAESYSMGTTAVYKSGLYTGTALVATFPNNVNLTRRDAVIAILGNATIYRYQWTEVNSWNQVVRRYDYYKVDLFISSLNESGGQFHLNGYYSGFINLKKYSNIEFDELPLQERYAVAFGIYFNGSDSSQLFGMAGDITNITTLQFNQQISWYSIFTSIQTTSSDLLGEINQAIGLAAALAGVALAAVEIPFADAFSGAALAVAVIGAVSSILGYVLSGILTVHDYAFFYTGVITNLGNPTYNGGNGAPLTISNWYTMDTIEVNGGVYQFPSNYAIVT